MANPITPPITVIARQAGDVRIHTFISSYESDNIANATHIIESKNVLVLIDAQFFLPYAQQFREYADRLNKPIERLYISHGHPDHWFGLEPAFNDIAVYALPETTAFIRDHGDQEIIDHKGLGDLVPKSKIIPQHIARPGAEIIDGVTYVFEKVINTEFDFLLTIRLPDINVRIVQDLIYSGTHLYLTTDMENWIRVLETMLGSDDELFLPGHGLPADKKEVAENVIYLTAAKLAYDEKLQNDAFKNFLLNRFPARQCPGIFDIYLPRLFGGASQF